MSTAPGFSLVETVVAIGLLVGALVTLSVVWDLADVALSIVIWPNLIALIILTPVVVRETRSYFERRPWEAIAEKKRSRS